MQLRYISVTFDPENKAMLVTLALDEQNAPGNFPGLALLQLYENRDDALLFKQ